MLHTRRLRKLNLVHSHATGLAIKTRPHLQEHRLSVHQACIPRSPTVQTMQKPATVAALGRLPPLISLLHFFACPANHEFSVVTCSVCGSGVTKGTAQRICNSGSSANSTCLPLTTDDALCANPPGTIASDGFDDVCNLVDCCNRGNTQAVELPSGKSIICSTANCTSICSLSNMRRNLTGEACVSSCTPTSSGRVCIFNAPSGAKGWGHVGWAFQVASTTSWVYGAAEDASGARQIPPGDPKSATSWDDTDDFTKVKDVFKTKQHGHPANYYTQYRCKNVDAPNIQAAKNEVQTVLYSGYSIDANNCLTKSIAVFEAYSPSLNLQVGYINTLITLPPPIGSLEADIPLGPNFYYDYVLSLYKWESSQRL